MRELDIQFLTLAWCWSQRWPSERKRKCHRKVYRGSGLCVLTVGIFWCGVLKKSLLPSFLAIICVCVEDKKLKGSDLTRFNFLGFR